jgi:hypothetical protein
VHTHSASTGDLLKLLKKATVDGAPKEVTERLQWFLHYKEHGSVSKTCAHFSIARTTFYRWYKRFDPQNLETLVDLPTVTPPSATEETPLPTVTPMRGCIFCKARTQLRPLWRRVGLLTILLSVLVNLTFVLLVLLPNDAHASSWSPTLLVNTESFNIIDDGDSSTDIELRFGDTANERLRWDVTNSRFQFTDDVHIEGNVTGSGTLTIDGAVTFGSTITLSDVTYTFPTSDGTATGKVLKTDGAGNLVWSDDSTGGGGGISQSEADDRYVNVEGDTMTGGLLINPGGDGTGVAEVPLEVHGTMSGRALSIMTVYPTKTGAVFIDVRANGTGMLLDSSAVDEPGIAIDIAGTTTAPHLSFGYQGTFDTNLYRAGVNSLQTDDSTSILGGLSVTGSIITEANITINSDNAAQDAVLTFGNDATAETLIFSDSTNRFEFSDDISTTGHLDVSSGTITGSYLDITNDVRINGVTYTFPYSDGSASGKVLKTDGGGNLVWSDDTDTNTQNTYEAGQGIGLNGTTFSLNSTITGSLANFTTVSGAIVHARDLLRSSGGLLVGGTSTLQAVTATTVDTTGNITTDANLTINEDSGAADAVLTFGNDAASETIIFSDSTNRFEFSDDIHVTGNIAASSLQTSGEVVYSDGSNIALTTGNTSGNILIGQSSGAPIWKAPSTAMVWFLDSTLTTGATQGAVILMPFGFTVSDIDLRTTTPPTGTGVIIDINENGSSIYSTKPQVQATQTGEDGFEVISDTTLAAGSEITVDIDQIGSTFAGSGLTIILHGTRTY